MPHITLNSAEPGIRGLLRYRPETGRPLSELAEVLRLPPREKIGSPARRCARIAPGSTSIAGLPRAGPTTAAVCCHTGGQRVFQTGGRELAGRNIDIVLGGLADAIRSRDPERIAEFLGPDLVWEGLEPGLRCDGRQQAMSVIRNRFAAAPLIVQAVEAIETGQHVIVGLRGPGFNGMPGDLETVGQIFNVFTLTDGKVVRWRDFLTRQEALEAANAEDQPWQ